MLRKPVNLKDHQRSGDSFPLPREEPMERQLTAETEVVREERQEKKDGKRKDSAKKKTPGVAKSAYYDEIIKILNRVGIDIDFKLLTKKILSIKIRLFLKIILKEILAVLAVTLIVFGVGSASTQDFPYGGFAGVYWFVTWFFLKPYSLLWIPIAIITPAWILRKEKRDVQGQLIRGASETGFSTINKNSARAERLVSTMGDIIEDTIKYYWIGMIDELQQLILIFVVFIISLIYSLQYLIPLILESAVGIYIFIIINNLLSFGFCFYGYKKMISFTYLETLLNAIRSAMTYEQNMPTGNEAVGNTGIDVYEVQS